MYVITHNWKSCSIHLLSRQFPEREDFEYGAAVGILAVQLYYNLSYKGLMIGGGMTGIGWKGGLLIAKAARTVQRRDKQVGIIAQELDLELDLACFAHSRLTGLRQL